MFDVDHPDAAQSAALLRRGRGWRLAEEVVAVMMSVVLADRELSRIRRSPAGYGNDLMLVLAVVRVNEQNVRSQQPKTAPSSSLCDSPCRPWTRGTGCVVHHLVVERAHFDANPAGMSPEVGTNSAYSGCGFVDADDDVPRRAMTRRRAVLRPCLEHDWLIVASRVGQILLVDQDHVAVEYRRRSPSSRGC